MVVPDDDGIDDYMKYTDDNSHKHIRLSVQFTSPGGLYKALFNLLIDQGAMDDFIKAMGLATTFLMLVSGSDTVRNAQNMKRIDEATFSSVMQEVACLLTKSLDVDTTAECRVLVDAASKRGINIEMIETHDFKEVKVKPEVKNPNMTLIYNREDEKFGYISKNGKIVCEGGDEGESKGYVDAVRMMQVAFTIDNLDELAMVLKEHDVDTAVFVTEYTVSKNEIEETKKIIGEDCTIFSVS